MAELNITQAEADALIAMEKHRQDETTYDFPGLGTEIEIPLVSSNGREHFLLDLSRGRIDLSKIKYQNRARQIIVLVRLDLAGSPHRNPDDAEVQCPHIHIYREGYGDKWAFDIPTDHFTDLSDKWVTLHDFMRYCNITKLPNIQRGLFDD